MSDETTEERQDNELAALQAIYGDDVTDNRRNWPWKSWKPLDIMLKLNPLHISGLKDVDCYITLHIKCCPLYPDRPPNIAIEKIHGLSTENGNKLLAELETLASQRCGEVMIFELAQHVQQFLHDHHRPILSFHEERLNHQKQMEQLKLQDIQSKTSEERQKMKDEIEKRKEMLRDADKRVHRSSTSQENSNHSHSDAPELVYYADIKPLPTKKLHRVKTQAVCTCNLKRLQELRIAQRNNRKVYIGNCLGHSSNGATTYLAIHESGEHLIAKKWTISAPSDFQTIQHYHQNKTNIQQELTILSRLKHRSLVPYLYMETVKEAKRPEKHSYFVFRDYVNGCSLKYLLSVCKFSDKFEALKLLRSVGVGVFEALKELHSASVMHRDLRSENVFVDVSGVVKLVGAGLDARLAEIHEGDSYFNRLTQAQDIYAAAQLLLSILSYEGTVLEVPTDLPGTAKDFFTRCLTEDEHSQWTAEQLVNHIFLVDQPVQQPSSKQKDEGSGSEDDDQVKKIYNISPPTDGHSRLKVEFEVLTWLGKGAFGDVVKVKNKLDDGFYAIKRIKLNPESVQLNKKITREVKLLSRLNHENVVRYYNAWIESTLEAPENEQDSTVKTPTKKKPGDSLEEVVAKLGNEVKVEWSISENVTQAHSSDSEDDEDDDDDDDDDDEQKQWWPDQSSSCIEFEGGSNQSETIPSEDVPETPRPQSVRLHQVLFIQMEFCEKHTLRQAIDSGLYQEHFRAWRLFREIVEGLAHVHQRGMIHRDLKPVNIFLDSNDHVKIGDFGLATKALGLPVDEKTKQQEEIGGSLTGQIGTALYVAPELLQAVGKVIYNQKVDIYSLGIILFEMFHPPISTGTERIVVLTNLRNKDIIMPKSFETEENSKQIHVIKWLLNHNASLRPTCVELLASEHVPRPVPEGALSGLLAHTLNERKARAYQRLIAACLDQKLSAAEDITYHGEVKSKPMDVLESLKDIVVRVFKRHGATEFCPPLLMPRSKRWDQHLNAVKVMTASGAVCHLPHDLRLPFARHIAYSGTKYMRRYIVDTVYREKHVLGFHPREIIECAFDIVTPKTESLWSDAELLVVAYHCASSLKVIIHLNHTELLRILLLSCGVPSDKHADLYPVLVDVRFGRITSLQLQTHLTSLCVTNRDVSNLIRLMEADVPVYEVKELVSSLMRQAKWAKIVRQAITELEEVYNNAKALGCDCPMTVAPFLAYNATQHSGVFWQMSVVRQRDHKPNKQSWRSWDVIAAGGRYDVLVEEFWKVAKEDAELKCTSVGFSLSLERMAAILKKMETELPYPIKSLESTLVCVCVWGTAGNGKDGHLASRRAQLLKKLWAEEVNCCSWPSSNVDADAHEMSKAGMVIMLEDAAVRVMCWNNDGVREHIVCYNDVVDFVKQKLQPASIRSPEGFNNRTISCNENEKANSPNISVTFITASDKMTKNAKRNCENQINTQITSLLVNLGLQSVIGRLKVHVLALSCEASCVRMLASHITAPLYSEDLAAAFKPIFNSFPKCHKILEDAINQLEMLAKQCNQSRSSEETQLYALYSIPDSLCRLIT